MKFVLFGDLPDISRLFFFFMSYLVFFCSSFEVLFSRWLDDIERKQAEMVASQIALEKLHQRVQLLTAENDMLKVDI